MARIAKDQLDTTLVDTTSAQTLSGKSMAGSANTFTAIPNSALTNSSVTVGTTVISLGAAATTLAGVTLTTPTIASFTNATHNHTNAAGGGQLTDAALSAAVSVSKGGTGATTLTSGSFLQGNGTSAVTATKTVPGGAVVGTTDTQTLTNKTVGDFVNVTGQSTMAAATAGNARLYASGTTNARPKWINESAVVESLITDLAFKRQDNTTNSSIINPRIEVGIGVVTNGSTKAVTFSAAFSAVPVVLIANIGGNASSGAYAYPSVGGPTGQFSDRVFTAVSQSTTGFTAYLSGTAPSSTQGVSFTWIAIGA